MHGELTGVRTTLVSPGVPSTVDHRPIKGAAGSEVLGTVSWTRTRLSRHIPGG